jgi:hypothetical protein
VAISCDFIRRVPSQRGSCPLASAWPADSNPS